MANDYVEEPVTITNPLVYWKNNRERYPFLADLAMKYKHLTAPPSSVPLESLFSETGIIDSNRRR